MKRTNLIAAGLLGVLSSITSVAFADEPSVHATVIVNVGAQSTTQTAAPAPAIAPAPTSDEWRGSVSHAALLLDNQATVLAQFATDTGIEAETRQEGWDLVSKSLRLYRDTQAGASFEMIARDHAELQQDGRLYIAHVSAASARQNIAMGNRIEALGEELHSFALLMNSLGAGPAVRPEPRPMPPVIVYQPAPPPPVARPLPPPPPRVITVQARRPGRWIVRAPRPRGRVQFRQGARGTVAVRYF